LEFQGAGQGSYSVFWFSGFQSWVPVGGSSGGEFVQGGLMGAGLRDKPLNVQNQS